MARRVAQLQNLGSVLKAGFFSQGCAPLWRQHFPSRAYQFTTNNTPSSLKPSLYSRFKQLLGDYKQLSKFRLSGLVVLTAGAGYVAGSGPTMDWAGLGWTSVGTLGAAACANTLNQIYEVANDKLMKRTSNRPLPAGRLGILHAGLFALGTGCLGLGVLAYQANSLTASLGAFNIALYAGIYTPLKQLSPANTWVGALVGAVPPLMGWASATGTLDPGALVLAGALYFWQLPHFLALAWLCKEDYRKGGFRMLSLLDVTGRRTAGAALRNCLYLLPLGAAAVAVGVAEWPFAVEATALTAAMAYPAVLFLKDPTALTARKLFKGSLMYLPLLLACMTLHRVPHREGAAMTWQDAAEHLSRLAEELVPRAVGGTVWAVHLAQKGLWVVLGLQSDDTRCPSQTYADAEDEVEVIAEEQQDRGKDAKSGQQPHAKPTESA